MPKARIAIEEVSALVAGLRERCAVYVDLTELRGYRYHTGVVFAAYASGLGEALARGGRYDNVGAVHGRARPATGFATDLRVLATLLPEPDAASTAIAATDRGEAGLQNTIRELRARGETVIVSLGGVRDSRCGRALEWVDGQWQVRSLANKETT
ncbi:MAG: ATP phosphoribosyltransferase regulatory subunit [Pseudomonadota bacterium]